MFYQLLFPDTEFFVVPVDADGITRENWRKTEEGIEAVSGEIGGPGVVPTTAAEPAGDNAGAESPASPAQEENP